MNDILYYFVGLDTMK